MAQQNSAKLIVNGVGAIAALVVVGWIGYTAFEDHQAVVCEGRYPSSTRFSLSASTGDTITLSELQARIGASEWGLMQNARIVPPQSARETPVLAVALAKGTSSGYRADQARGGISFTWVPSAMSEANPKSACLAYRVYLPKGFKFVPGGTLPGLMIGQNFDPRGGPFVGAGAAVRPGWNREGGATVNVQYATAEGWKNPSALSAKSSWPAGRWVDIEQEVILNEPGKKNGIVRLWLDGTLVGETTTAALRGDDTLAMAGIIADVHYGGVTSTSSAQQDAEIRISPFVVRWN